MLNARLKEFKKKGISAAQPPHNVQESALNNVSRQGNAAEIIHISELVSPDRSA